MNKVAPIEVLGWYLVFVFSTCLHEAAHAFAAWRLGDSTAYHGGQVTLNPLPHIRREPVGMVLVPLLTMFTAGWMMGWASAPYDPRWAMQFPKRSGVMALAGPLANLLLVILSAIVMVVGIRLGWWVPLGAGFAHVVEVVQAGPLEGLALIVSIVFSLNLLLCLFNLMPVPPLDGSSIALLFMPHHVALSYMEMIRRPGLWLIGLFVAWRVFPRIFEPIYERTLIWLLV
jgi:Zn-dependent protease